MVRPYWNSILQVWRVFKRRRLHVSQANADSLRGRWAGRKFLALSGLGWSRGILGRRRFREQFDVGVFQQSLEFWRRKNDVPRGGAQAIHRLGRKGKRGWQAVQVIAFRLVRKSAEGHVDG